MLGEPIGNNEALETELSFEEPVLRLAVLASMRIVQSVIRAHNVRGACMDAILEGPEVPGDC